MTGSTDMPYRTWTLGTTSQSRLALKKRARPAAARETLQVWSSTARGGGCPACVSPSGASLLMHPCSRNLPLVLQIRSRGWTPSVSYGARLSNARLGGGDRPPSLSVASTDPPRANVLLDRADAVLAPRAAHVDNTTCAVLTRGLACSPPLPQRERSGFALDEQLHARARSLDPASSAVSPGSTPPLFVTSRAGDTTPRASGLARGRATRGLIHEI